MLSYLTMVANPYAAFSRVLNWTFETTSSSNTDEWGTLVTAASISSGFQLRTTETGHPICAYCSNKFAAGCCLALYLGNTRPRNFLLMTPSGSVISSGNRRLSSSNAVADLFSRNVTERCPVFVLAVQLPPTRSTCAFSSVLRRFESARPTRVLNLVLRILDGRSNLSR